MKLHSQAGGTKKGIDLYIDRSPGLIQGVIVCTVTPRQDIVLTGTPEETEPSQRRSRRLDTPVDRLELRCCPCAFCQVRIKHAPMYKKEGNHDVQRGC